MNEKWIDDIRDRMSEFQQAPPEGLLESVKLEIKARRIRKIRKRWLLSVGVVAALLVGVVPIAYMTGGLDSVDSSSFIASRTDLPVDIPVNGKELNSRSNKPSSDNEKPVVAQVFLGKESGLMNPETNVSETDVVEMQVAESRRTEDFDTEDFESPVIICNEPDDADLRFAYADPVEMNNHSRSTIGVSTSVNGIGGLFAANSGAMPDHYAHAGAQPMTRMGGGILEESSSNALPDPIFMEIFDHKFPLRFSLDYSWPIAHNFEIGTGLTYSYLRSDIRCGNSDAPLLHFEQKLHFLGVPVAFRYTPLRIRKIGLYLSAGMMVEKCIGGKIVGKSEDCPDDYSYVGSEERPFQFSVDIAGGVRYDFNRNCGVYLEPGAGFYLKNGSRLRTLYSERPVTFNINVGLRFSH